MPSRHRVSKKVMIVLLLIASTIVIASAAAIVLVLQNKDDKKTVDNSQSSDKTTDMTNDRFADYKLEEINVTPSVKDYTIASDLSNVYMYNGNNSEYEKVVQKELTTTMRQELVKNWFVISEGKNKEFFPVYENNRYDYVPNFITTDSLLHTYHLIFDSSLKNLEETELNATATSLSKDMVTKSTQQYEQTNDESLKVAAKRNIAFFAVSAKLFDPKYEVPELVKNEVNAELALINSHSTNEASKVMNIGVTVKAPTDALMEDYTQYIPRGHYTKSDELKNYFRGMMWLGRMTFLADKQTTTSSALLITDTLDTDEAVFKKWDKIFAAINFFVGKADDLGFYEYKGIKDEVFGDENILKADSSKYKTFWEKAKKLEAPKINSIPIFDESIQPDKDAATKGFRFMGQRYTLDANIFQNLIYRSVKEKSDGTKRMLPTSLDIPASLGDETAKSIIKSDTNAFTFPNYEEQMTKLRTEIKSYDQDKWTQNLYWAWLYTLNGNIGETPSGYPQFMRTEKWQKKELNTYTGSWTELKHDTILYSKQAYAEMGAAGPDTDMPDDKGYVEPNVEVYRRMLALVRMTKEGLTERGLITKTSDTDNNKMEYCSTMEDKNQKTYCNLEDMEYVSERLLEISRKELTEEKLSDIDYDFIRYYGGYLETMFMMTLDVGADKYTAVDLNPIMLVADVATDPNGAALEEAVGYVNTIYVVVPVEGKLRVAKGGVYSQYEFSVATDKRMTDEEWRTQLSSGKAPQMTKWQKSLISK